MPAPINASDTLQNQSQYTFVFDMSILGLGPTGAQNILAATLQNDPDLGGVYVTHPGLNPVGTEVWITFNYLGPSGYNAVSDVAENIKQIIEANFLGSKVDFSRAMFGASGDLPALPADPNACKLPVYGQCLDGYASTLKWFAVAGIIGLGLILAIKVG